MGPCPPCPPRPLQERPCMELQACRLKSSEAPDPGGPPLQLCPPPAKRPRPGGTGKENGVQLVLGRRSRRRRDPGAGLSWDRLPDELLLRVLMFLRLQDLVRASAVCRTWNRLALDGSLWSSVDLEGLVQADQALQHLLGVGVCRLRCPRVCVETPRLAVSGPLPLTHLDLSGSLVPVPVLDSVLRLCSRLQCASLEGLPLSDPTLRSLSSNVRLQQLNLSGCSGFSAAALRGLLQSCCRLLQLNASWCVFRTDHVRTLVLSVSPAVTHLNLSGYRETLRLDDVKLLVDRCPRIQTLDLSDCTLLTAESFAVLQRLPGLQHLSLSRCYHIHTAALTDVGQSFPALSLLDVFGLGPESHLAALKAELPRVSVNSRPFSAVARPSPAPRDPAHRPAGGPASTMWGRPCRLRFRP